MSFPTVSLPPAVEVSAQPAPKPQKIQMTGSTVYMVVCEIPRPIDAPADVPTYYQMIFDNSTSEVVLDHCCQEIEIIFKRDEPGISELRRDLTISHSSPIRAGMLRKYSGMGTIYCEMPNAGYHLRMWFLPTGNHDPYRDTLHKLASARLGIVRTVTEVRTRRR